MTTAAIPNRPTGGTVRAISDIIADFDAILTFLNGKNLDASNITDAAITTALLRDANVTTPKIADANVTYAKLATDAKSSFLKLATVADKKIAFGQRNSGSFGGTNRSADAIPHGLGATPTVSFVWANIIAGPYTSTGVDENVACSLYSVDATNITVISQYVKDGVTSAVGTVLYWLAIA